MATNSHVKISRKPLGIICVDVNSSSSASVLDKKSGKRHFSTFTKKRSSQKKSLKFSASIEDSSSFCNMLPYADCREGIQNMSIHREVDSRKENQIIRPRCTNPLFKSISYSLQYNNGCNDGDIVSSIPADEAYLRNDVELFRNIYEEDSDFSTSTDNDVEDDEIVRIVMRDNNEITNAVKPDAFRVNHKTSHDFDRVIQLASNNRFTRSKRSAFS